MSRLVTVARFWDAPEMYAAAAAMRAAGFHPVTAEFFHAMVNPLLFVALGGVRLQVPEAEAEEAAELIRRCRERRAADDAAAGPAGDTARDDGLVCPHCGAEDYFRLRSWIFTLGLYLAWSLYAPLTTGRLLCRACGRRWRPREGAA